MINSDNFEIKVLLTSNYNSFVLFTFGKVLFIPGVVYERTQTQFDIRVWQNLKLKEIW